MVLRCGFKQTLQTLRSLSEMAHQDTGAFGLTWHDHSYRCWTTCLLILSMVSDTGPFIHQPCPNNCLSLPFCKRLLLPRLRGRTQTHMYTSLMQLQALIH